MFHEKKAQYECDKCSRMIPRSEPVGFRDGMHFCKHTGCLSEYLVDQVHKISERMKNPFSEMEVIDEISVDM